MIILIAFLLFIIVLSNPVSAEILAALIRLVIVAGLWIAGIVMVIVAIGFLFAQVE